MSKLKEIVWFLIFIRIYHFVNCENESLIELLSNPPNQEYFTKYGHCSVSTSRLRDSYYIEGQMVNTILKGYKHLERDRHDKRNAKDYTELDEEIKTKLNFILSAREKENTTTNPTKHPINALHFLRRIVYQFNPLFNKVFTTNSLQKRNFYQELSVLIDKYIRQYCFCWPTTYDLQNAISGLARIMKIYKISKKELINGIIFNRTSVNPLQLDEIIALAQEANRRSYYQDVLELSDLLLNDPKYEINKNENQMKNLIRMKASALFQTDKKKEAIDYLKKIIQEKPFNTQLLERDIKYYLDKSKIVSGEDEKQELKVENFDYLCRENFNSSIQNSLRCFYRRIQRGWDRAKIELLNVNPPIYKYYGVIDDAKIHEIFNLVKVAKRNQHLYLQRNEVNTNENLSKEEGIFWDEDYDVLRQLSKRISYETALETNNHKYNTRLSSSGPFKINNYGIGGYEESEIDYLAKENTKDNRDISIFGGDRLATWLYLITDKIEGGKIVFPKIKMSISLEQGTGLLWFNLMKNGTVNPLSEHMDCPVAYGSKWVGKKFIHENGNMFTRRCYRKTVSFF